jgi:hypothetical protein
MTDPRSLPPDNVIERALFDLGSAIAFPPAPSLSDGVEARIAGQAPASLGLHDRMREPLWAGLAAAIALLVVFGVALLALPGARSAIAERLGLRGVKIEYVPGTATVTGQAPGAGLFLGERVSLEDARQRAAFSVLVPGPPAPPVPAAVHIDSLPTSSIVWLVYAPSPTLPESPLTGIGMLIAEFRGDLQPALLSKGLPATARLERVTVNGATGYWIEGSPHSLLIRDAADRTTEVRTRLAGNTLLWTRGNVTLRLESMLSRDEAIRIAETMR